jgi:hypothetical protein
VEDLVDGGVHARVEEARVEDRRAALGVEVDVAEDRPAVLVGDQARRVAGRARLGVGARRGDEHEVGVRHAGADLRSAR